MKKVIYILLLSIVIIIVSACSPQAENPVIDPKVTGLSKEQLTSEYITWYGRVHYAEEQVYFYHTATGFSIAFIGKKLEITLSLKDAENDIYFSLAKDGQNILDGYTIILDQVNQNVLIEFDTYDRHSIELVKRSEPSDGTTSLVSVKTDGEIIVQEIEDKPHFLLIGASGISGNGAIGEPHEGRTTRNSSSLHSFGHLTANHFQGSYEFVSASGWGLAFGFNDQSGNNNILNAYDYVGIDYKKDIIMETYHKKQADIIIVNIGGNDYSAVINQLNGFEKARKIETFKEAVFEMLMKLRGDHPAAHIYWTMTSGSLNGQAAKSVIDLMDEADRNFIHVITIKGVGESGPVGSNNHASYETHQASSDILIFAVEPYL